jgi:hypothetical protein
MARLNGQTAKRDEDGLLAQQRNALTGLLAGESWPEVQRRLGLSSRQLGRWLREDEHFRAAYEDLFDFDVDTLRKQIQANGTKAAERLDESLDAVKTITIHGSCPNCRTKVEVATEVPDWNTRMKAIDMVLRVSRVLKDVTKVEADVPQPSLTHHLALAMTRSGKGDQVPPHIKEDLHRMKLLDGQDTETDEEAATLDIDSLLNPKEAEPSENGRTPVHN